MTLSVKLSLECGSFVDRKFQSREETLDPA
jgi:hypothetical protein